MYGGGRWNSLDGAGRASCDFFPCLFVSVVTKTHKDPKNRAEIKQNAETYSKETEK